MTADADLASFKAEFVLVWFAKSVQFEQEGFLEELIKDSEVDFKGQNTDVYVQDLEINFRCHCFDDSDLENS